MKPNYYSPLFERILGLREKIKLDYPKVLENSKKRRMREALVIASDTGNENIVTDFLEILGAETVENMIHSKKVHSFVLNNDTSAYIVED